MSDRPQDLFGEPARTAELSQFFTPAWLARRAARWLPKTGRILEPSAGRGNLIEAALRQGVSIDRIQAIELDAAWCNVLRQRWPGLWLYAETDFLELHPEPLPGAAFMNPPYEDDQDARHVALALEWCGRAIVIVKADFEYSAERDRVLWRKARVVRRGICVDRPAFGETEEKGGGGAARNYVALDIRPEYDVGGAYAVLEERWRKNGGDDAP